ncbi:peroxidase [Flavimobilis marinus]|uniref:Deferrochelatase n=1 Tax=Flavimobilis marinus TaxID=285351 RepID=A0A1I2DRD8_9MICO|nr:iron uptake transporter deferrochelatase/peroxidase subunit [Flavimobilis marinus]GHG44544.1 peroxidase [Flavimobilis marinus]SFE83047.1 deferrochelatase/peroxidase EfeB [Flavimobilis marinus]
MDDVVDTAEPGREPRTLSRRSLLGLAGAGLAAVGLGGIGGYGVADARSSGAAPATAAPSATRTYPLTGAHQAGIVTPAQDRLHFAAFDVTSTSRTALESLLRRWTYAADRMVRGLPAGDLTASPYDAPPSDTGEAEGLPPSGLTITFGFGPSLFADAEGRDRFGLAQRRPALLTDLPHFPGDTLDPARTGGDLCIQACADDPQVAVHAVRNLSRIAFGTAAIRWSQLGYGRTSSTSTAQTTPRNLFGFKDGTANIMAEESAALAEHVWVGADDDPGASWLAGGSYLVARRIRMTIETWDRASLREQETLVGRTKASGAPLSGGDEHTAPDFALAGRGGAPLIDPASHVALAHPDRNDGARMLRRGYNYTDGSDGLGRLDAGLFFLAFVRDPARQYVPMQTAMARNDLLVEYLRHTGSGLFAIPPGVPDGARLSPTDGAFVGEQLFA